MEVRDGGYEHMDDSDSKNYEHVILHWEGVSRRETPHTVTHLSREKHYIWRRHSECP